MLLEGPEIIYFIIEDSVFEKISDDMEISNWAYMAPADYCII